MGLKAVYIKDQKKAMIFVLICLPILILIIYNSYLASLSVDGSDLYNDLIAYESRNFENRPFLYLVSIIFNQFIYAYIFFVSILFITYKRILEEICVDEKYTYTSLFLLFASPFAVKTFYGNILYNGVALALIIGAVISKNKFIKGLLLVFGFALHFKVVALFLFLFLFPYFVYQRYGKFLFTVYLVGISYITIEAITKNLFGLAELFKMSDDAIYQAQTYVAYIRDDDITRIKIGIFLCLTMLIVRTYGLNLFGVESKKLLYSTNIVALILLLIPGIPFIERFVQPQIQYSWIMLIVILSSFIGNIIKRKDVMKNKLPYMNYKAEL